MINDCEYCCQKYCMNCSNAENWKQYCSQECEDKAKNEN